MSLGNVPDSFLISSESEMKSDPRHSYSFKSFRLDVEDRRLLRDGVSVALEPKTFDVLVALVERGGHLVEKDELLRTVWPDAFVEEVNVARAVYTLRKALGEGENGERLIETVPKKGYRFVAKVTEIGEKESPVSTDRGTVEANLVESNSKTERSVPVSAKVESGSASAVEAFPRRRIVLFAIGFISAVFLISALSFNFRPVFSPGRKQIRSIAILPAKPIDSANRDEMYEIGIADSLISRLGTMKGIMVRPLGATRQYSDVDKDPLAAGKELQADYVLAANYQIADGKIRVTAQLFDVATGRIEESYKTVKDAGNIIALQESIADEVGRLLQTRLALTPNTTTAKRGTNNEEAYRLYLQGKNLTLKRNNEAYKKAIECFEQAIRLDQNYALAYARMAHAYYSWGLPENNLANAVKAKEIVNKALELDPFASEAYASRGYISMLYDWDLSSAEKDFLRAIELEPSNDTAHWLYALVLTYRQRFDEGLAEMETALNIDPGAPVYMTHRGRILYYARRYDEAITQFQRSIDLGGGAMPYAWLVRLYETKGDYASAYQSFLKREERSPRKDQMGIFQKAYETAGWPGLKNKEVELATNRFFDRASLYALQGEKDAAFEDLNKAVEKRDWRIITLTVEPAFDNLRGDRRFDELLGRAGLK